MCYPETMKRDMDLIRLLLLNHEGATPCDLSGYTQEQIAYHDCLLIDAGLVRGAIAKGSSGEWKAVHIIGLNWIGHDFLDAARNETIWNQLKAKLKKSALELPIDLMKEILAGLLKAQLNL